MIAPALPEVAEEFGIESGVTQNMVLSVFVLAYAVGPLIFVSTAFTTCSITELTPTP
jgi:hypothetical protein